MKYILKFSFVLSVIILLNGKSEQTYTSNSSVKVGFAFINQVVPECSPGNSNGLEDHESHLKDFKKGIASNSNESYLAFAGYSILALPQDVFENISLKSLILENVTLDLILEPNYRDNSIALNGLKNLESLIVLECQDIYGWDWMEFGQLDSLKNIHLSNSPLYFLSRDILNLAAMPRYLSVEDCSVYWTESIENSDNLEWISLKKNKLDDIPKDFIRKRASKLRHLDLSHNRLKHLPDGFTQHMSELREFDLSHNQLTTIAPSEIMNMWNNLQELWLNDNQLTLSKSQTNLCFLFKKLKDKNFETKVMYWYAAKVKIANEEKSFVAFRKQDVDPICL